MPYELVRERYFTPRAKRSPFCQRATVFQDLVIRCVRFGKCHQKSSSPLHSCPFHVPPTHSQYHLFPTTRPPPPISHLAFSPLNIINPKSRQRSLRQLPLPHRPRILLQTRRPSLHPFPHAPARVPLQSPPMARDPRRQ